MYNLVISIFFVALLSSIWWIVKMIELILNRNNGSIFEFIWLVINCCLWTYIYYSHLTVS